MVRLEAKGIARVGGETVHVPTACLSLVLGGLFGWIAQALTSPLPWLLGALIATAAAALMGFRPFGHDVGIPTLLRQVFVPVIGVAIGAAFVPGILGEVTGWWPTVLALMLYVPLAHAMAFLVARHGFGIDPATAYYGTMPGGFVEASILGDAAGADAALLATLQFLRLILCIVLIPLGFSIAIGHAVGSAGGAVIGSAEHPLTLPDWLILGAAGLVGALIGKAIRLPASIISGPILASGLLHLLGWVEGGPPLWLINLTQVVIGVSLGGRFAGRTVRILLEGARTVAITLPLTFALAAVFAVLLAPVVGERWQAVFLAFAPGGLVEMALVALSLEVGVLYVTLHHVIRILFAVGLAKALQDVFVPKP